MRKKIKESLRKANAWNFVSLLSNGIDEMILDRGLRLSGEKGKELLWQELFIMIHKF